MSGEADLAVVAAEVRACTLCPLANGRTMAVPGEGNAISDVLLVGEGPGQREDATGRPFVGAAGQLLEEMLATIGWKRTDVFITNVVKCRPPGNRDPEPAEISACSPVPRPPGAGAGPGPDRDPGPVLAPALPARGAHLRGRTAGSAASGSRFVLPMYHPAAALRATALRETLARDFRALPAALLEARAALEAEQADSGPSQSEPMGPGQPVGPGEEPLPTAPDDDQLTLF